MPKSNEFNAGLKFILKDFYLVDLSIFLNTLFEALVIEAFFLEK